MLSPRYNAASANRVGNMTTVPKPSSLADGLTLKYDAWNRLVQVTDDETVVAKYEYDGTGRRTKKHIDSDSPDDPDGIDRYEYHFYVGEQLVETRDTATLNSDPSSLDPHYQWVWSPRYIDAPILRSRYVSGTLHANARMYFLNDANMNVTTLMVYTTTGEPGSPLAWRIVERLVYDAYGRTTFYNGSWNARLMPTYYDNYILYTGRYLDLETNLYHYRARYLHAELGRFVSRDRAKADRNLYRYVYNSPVMYTDSFGLWGDNTHKTATAGWAQLVAGYPGAAATAVGNADAAVDSGSTGPMPWQDQSYHFNRNLNGGTDSRMVHFQEHFEKAKKACLPRTDDPETAAKELGTALHPLQDWVAHGEHCMTNPGAIGEVHNSRSPQTDFGDPSGYPDDPTLDAKNGPDGRPAGLAITTITVNGGMAARDYAIYERGTKRLHLTADLTIPRLKEFRDGIDKKACGCRKYFGLE